MFVQPRGCSQDSSTPRQSRRLQPRSRVECMRRVLGRLAAGIQISTLRIPLHLTGASAPSGWRLLQSRVRLMHCSMPTAMKGPGAAALRAPAAMPSSRGCEPRRRSTSQPPRLRSRLPAEERRVFRDEDCIPGKNFVSDGGTLNNDPGAEVPSVSGTPPWPPTRARWMPTSTGHAKPSSRNRSCLSQPCILLIWHIKG
ncbi:hypothetical protein V5799_024879, partial [Amblyomma americanum]